MQFEPTVSEISARTRLFGLLGHPVAHSLSPAMQNAALRAYGIDARYLAFDVEPEAFGAALAGARALGFGGLNVTVPHKEAALALAATADPTATLAGAANTLVPVSGGWRAHNTDVEGFVLALKADLGLCPKGRRALVLGAGGAARAAVVALAREGAQEIFVANRNKSRAERLCAELTAAMPGSGPRAVELDAAPDALLGGDLLVSATPVGLDPGARWPWPLERLPPAVLVYDMAYRSGHETALVAETQSRGVVSASGRSMLLAQGALAFTLWTGRPAPTEIMREALKTP